MALENFFQSIGLDKKNQKVYLALLKLQDAPVSLIAKSAGLPRTTTYHQLKKIVDLGLATTYRSGGAKRFAAENVKKIKGVLEAKAALFNRFLPDLMKIAPVSEQVGALRMFEGDEAIFRISEDRLGCREKVVRSIGNFRELKEVAGSKHITFTDLRVEKKVFAKCLRPKDDDFESGWLESQATELRAVRLLPEALKAPGMTYIYDDNVAVITVEDGGMGFIIKSKTFSQLMKNVFDALWEISEKTQK
jgi:sugar-specific transcriptional regulator TrmB